MERTILLNYHGMLVCIFKKVADMYMLKPGHDIPDNLFWEIMKINADYGITVLTPLTSPQN